MAQFRACWKRASQISVMYDNDPWFAKRFKISRDAWITDIAMNPSTDSAWMQQQLDSWWFDFTLRTGLQHPDRSVEWHEPPPHPMTVANNFCRENDCVGHTLNAVGAAASTAMLLVCIASAPACGEAVAIGSTVGIAASGVGVVNTAVRVKNNDAHEIDLLVSTGTFVIGASGPFARSVKRIVTPFMSTVASGLQIFWDSNGGWEGLRDGQYPY